MFYLTLYEEEFPQLFKFNFFENDRKFLIETLEIKCIAIKEGFEASHRGNIILY